MVLRVDYLIYGYMILCACMLVFDLFYLSKEHWMKKDAPKKIAQCKKQILEKYLLSHHDKMILDAKTMQNLTHKLKRQSDLIIFHEAVAELLASEKDREGMYNWLYANREIFILISEHYVDKGNNMKKALYAYVVWQYRLCGKVENDPFVRKMLLLCMEPSLYCRENALCALYAAGGEQHVAKAYGLLARNGIEHSQKLVTDGLLQFAGDHNDLAEALWADWDLFPPAYQTSFVNYIRMTSDCFSQRFLALLQTRETDSEVKFAILRYYRRYRYADAAPVLLDFVRDWQRDDWEYASLAALALENYPDAESIRTLWEGCRSVHWHVRDNASESLLKIAGTEQIEKMIEEEEDVFARDVLQYKLTKKLGGAIL